MLISSFHEDDENDFDDFSDAPANWSNSTKFDLSNSSDWSSSEEDDALLTQPESNEWMDQTREYLVLGTIYLNGCLAKRIEKNEKTALEYFMKAHELGHPRGSYKVGEIMFQTDPLEAEKYFIISMSSFLEKMNDTEELYFGESDFEFMLNDFRSGTLKYLTFYEIVSQHSRESPHLTKIMKFTESCNPQNINRK